jgi:predicted ferric reductase
MLLTLSTILYSIGKLFGITGFVLLGLLIFSGDTARFWNRWIGLDKIIKFQRKFSYFVAFFVIFHPIFFILSTKSVSGFLIPNFTYAPLTVGIIAMYIFIGIMIASKLYKRISYRVWQYIHILTYVLFFFALYHGLNGGSTSAYLPIYYTAAWMIIIGIIYRTQYKIRARKTSQFLVKSITMETHDTFTLTVDGHKDFVAGQFFFLRLNKNRLYARHPFTVSGKPGDDLSFTIKLAGRFTQTAKELKIGDEILIDGPFGNFIPKTEKDLVFIAGGVGITPFMSILRDHINKNIDQNITLIYGSRTEADIIFKKEIDTIDKPWFKKVYLLSLVEESTLMSPNCEKGFICKDVLNRYVSDVKNSLYYICGPEIMKNNTKKLLKEEGVSGGQVFVEDFFW